MVMISAQFHAGVAEVNPCWKNPTPKSRISRFSTACNFPIPAGEISQIEPVW